MKILYSLNSGNPGGMEQHVLYLVRGMIKRGHEVHVWCKSGEIFNWYKNEGAIVTDASIKTDIDPTYISALAHYLEDNKIDVCHSHELKAVVNSLSASNKAKTPVKVAHTHTPLSEWPASNAFTKIKRFFQIKLYTDYINRYSSCEIALTNSRKTVKEHEGIKPEKLKVIPNCYNSQAFNIIPEKKLEYRNEIRKRYGIPENALVFGNVSRLSEEKNQEVLIEAFSHLTFDQNEPVYLLIAGGGVLENYLRELIKQKNLENRIFITGVFAQEDLPKYYFASDVFVFPTKAEGFGIVLIEALAAGLPVLASDLEVLKEVGADTVDYFTVGNHILLSKLMNSYVHYFQQNHTIPVNEKGITRVTQLYTEEAFTKAYEDLYGEYLK